MEHQEFKEIIDVLPKGRTLFRYFKDRYAFLLLARAAEAIGAEGKTRTSVAQLKRGRFARLLTKPSVQQWLATRGSGELDLDEADYVWSQHEKQFVLTLSSWGHKRHYGHNQTSRPGCNLVLQLNFSNEHSAPYRRLLKPEMAQLFNYSNHPVLEGRDDGLYRDTLAWSRIDLDFDTGEALVEEIQSDWLRCADDELGYARWRREHVAEYGSMFEAQPYDERGIEPYVKEVLLPYKNMWAEAMLSATIVFIRDELGIKRIAYHSAETGAAVKQIHPEHAPPRSLYSKLPKQFCFTPSARAPEFLLRNNAFRCKYRHLISPMFYWLQLESNDDEKTKSNQFSSRAA